MRSIVFILLIGFCYQGFTQTTGTSKLDASLVGKWIFDKEDYFDDRNKPKPYRTTLHKNPTNCYLKLESKSYFNHAPWKQATDAMSCIEGYGSADMSLTGRWRTIKCGDVSNPNDCLEVITSTGSEVYIISSITTTTLKLQSTGGTEALFLYYFHK